MKISILLAAFVAAAACLLKAQNRPVPSVREQTSFNEAGPIRRPVPLSPGVLRALLRTDEVRETLQHASEAERRDPAQLFKASEIHLHGPDEIDLIVAGEGRMSGADNDWYWVVRSARTNPEVILFVGCLGLEVLKSSTQGYLDIQAWWSSAALSNDQIYHFDGKQYKLWKETGTHR